MCVRTSQSWPPRGRPAGCGAGRSASCCERRSRRSRFGGWRSGMPSAVSGGSPPTCWPRGSRSSSIAGRPRWRLRAAWRAGGSPSCRRRCTRRGRSSARRACGCRCPAASCEPQARGATGGAAADREQVLDAVAGHVLDHGGRRDPAGVGLPDSVPGRDRDHRQHVGDPGRGDGDVARVGELGRVYLMI